MSRPDARASRELTRELPRFSPLRDPVSFTISQSGHCRHLSITELAFIMIRRC